MKHLLIMQDGEAFEGTFKRVKMARWGKKRNPEPTLVFETEKGILATPTRFIQELTPILGT